jgi:predicted membrane-bound spermidine synthase
LGWILPLVAVSGVVSFSYEVLWTRLLGQVLGGSVYAFATMLASFLLGITLGSALASRFATTRRRSAGGFAVAQLGAAALSLGAFGALDFVPGWARNIGASSHGSLLANASIAAAVLLPAALCFGATFPFAVRLLARDEAHAGPATARVYAWNTVGAVIGALSAGLILLPSLGFVATITAGAAASLALALAASLLIRPALKPAAAIAALGLAALLFVQPSPPWKILRTHPGTGQQTQGELTYFGVGRSATVMLIDNGSQWLLSTNGLSEAAIQRAGAPIHRSLTTRWLSVLPVLARPEARSLLLIGLGGGLTLQAVPSSIEHIDVIELEQEVVNANLAVSGLRDSDPLSDPRVHLHVNDARGALMLADTRYDVIVSQPSHPWTAGASHLYTREFFELIRNHLSPEGVFSQWIGMRFVDEELLRSLIATLVDVFPNVRVYQPVQASVVFLASEAPLPVEARAKLAFAGMPDEFARYGLRVLEDVAAGLVLDERGAREIAAGGFVNTDHHNQLAIRSPRLRARQALLRGGAGKFFAPFEPYPEQAGELDQSYLVRRLFAASPPDRAAHVAAAILDPAVREASLGWLDLAGGRLRSARRHYQNALELDPSSTEARAGWLLLSKSRVYAGEETPLLAELDPLDEAIAAVLAGWRAANAQDWEGLRALDERLAEIELRHPLFSEAARLRATWRMEGDPTRANEALEMLDSITAVRPSVVDLILRARAANRSQLPFAALSTLQEAVTMIRRPAEARLALAELAELPAGFQPEAVQRLRARLRRPRR